MTLILASEFARTGGKIADYLTQRGLAGSKALFIITAALAEGYKPDPAENIAPLERIGLTVETYDLRGKNEAEVREKLADVAVVSVSGGNSYCLLEHMQACDFKTLIWEALERGVVYIGSSAGSIVCSPDVDYVNKMDDASKSSLQDTRGLGLVRFSFIPHLGSPHHGPAAQACCDLSYPPSGAVALDDSQFLVVEKNVVRVFQA